MITLEKTEVMGWEHAIRGMRNPMNSWDKTDTIYGTYWGEIDGHQCFDTDGFTVGKNDRELMGKLRSAGTDHRKFMRMLVVYVDITAPLYWWKEFDTYKVGTVANSCSTMHKIHAKEFTLDDFSYEHIISNWVGKDNVESFVFDIINEGEPDYSCSPISPLDGLETIIRLLNASREAFIKTKDKKFWWQMIQLLPTSYNQRRTVMLNYEVLANIYKSRKNHKLDEWRTLCDWIEKLPESHLITGKEG